MTYRGRSSGRSFTIPVMYAECDGTLTIFVARPEEKKWWRNLRGGADVEVWLRGRRECSRADIVNDRAAADAYLRRYPRSRRVQTAVSVGNGVTPTDSGDESALALMDLAHAG